MWHAAKGFAPILLQGGNAVDVYDTQPNTPPNEAGYILEFEHGQNYDNVPTVTGPVYGIILFSTLVQPASATLFKRLYVLNKTNAHIISDVLLCRTYKPWNFIFPDTDASAGQVDYMQQ